MFGNKESAKWLWLLGGLLVANVAYYYYLNWGLITIDARAGKPLGEVIRSIEWQGWVKIYTNLPTDSKVKMFVESVPLSEAMETLAANVDVPAPAPGLDDGQRPPRNGAATNAPGMAGPGGGGPPGGRGGGFGGGGRRAEWNLAFFVGPTATDVKQEIAQFQAGDPAIDAKVFTYGTQIQMIADETVDAAPDPHSQGWPGVRPADPAAPATDSGAPPAPPVNRTPTVQTYLADFAQAANIWIMSTGTWAPEVAAPPAPDSSIIRAVKNFVSSQHGVVTQALVLRAGRGGPRTEARNDFGNDDAWADRMRNAINGLPADQRPQALNQLNAEIDFRKSLKDLPPEQRQQKIFAHFAEKMLYGERLSRLSPEKRARVYQRMVAMRQAAKAQK